MLVVSLRVVGCGVHVCVNAGEHGVKGGCAGRYDEHACTMWICVW